MKDRAVDVVFDNKQLGYGSEFIQSLQDNILEPKILDLMKEESRKYTTEELMAKGGSLAFEQKVQEVVKSEFKNRGLELMTFSSQLTFSKSVTERIDKRNEVNQNIAVIDQQIEEQKKRLELARLEAETNKLKSEGITEKLLQQQFIENGTVKHLYTAQHLSHYLNKQIDDNKTVTLYTWRLFSYIN